MSLTRPVPFRVPRPPKTYSIPPHRRCTVSQLQIESIGTGGWLCERWWCRRGIIYLRNTRLDFVESLRKRLLIFFDRLLTRPCKADLRCAGRGHELETLQGRIRIGE